MWTYQRYRQEGCFQGLHWSNTWRTHSTESTWWCRNAFSKCCFRLWEVFVQAHGHKKWPTGQHSWKTVTETLQEPTRGLIKSLQLLVCGINTFCGRICKHNVCSQDLVVNPNIPDPFELGWSSDADNIPVPILSDIAIAPESVVELVRCGCGISKCSRRCSCRRHNLTCTEACACGADEECINTAVLRNLKILIT